MEHLLAQYVVSLDKFNNRLIIDKTGFDTVETASSLKDTKRSELTPEREKQLREIGWLEDFDAEDNPIFSTARKRNKQHREEVAKVIDILNANPDDTGEPKMWRKTKTKAGRDRWEAGVPSEKQMQALRNSDLDPSYVEKIDKIRNAILKGDGTIWGNDYYKAITGGKYDSRAKVKFSLIVPFALEATQAGNINIKAFNLSKLEQKIGNYADQRPAFFDAWNGDTDAFRRDIVDFFQGPSRGKLFPEGDRKDLIYQFLGIKNKQNPLSGEWVDNSRLIESNRIERSTNLEPYENLDKIPFDYGKALRGEYMPEPNQQQGARFMPAPAEGENMVAVHNLSADNLRHSLKMGGIANPSMAILDVNKGNFEGYGDITLVASKDLIDPKKGAKVFGADIYSPRYPDITTEIPSGTSSKIRKYLDQLPYKDTTGSDFDFSGLSYSVEDRGWSRAAEEHNGLQAAYLQEKGILPDLDAAAAQEKDPYFKKVAARRVVEDIIRKPEHSENFRNWVNELPEREGWDFKEKIFKGYTNLGNRRYTPHTLDNVVKIMKRNIRGGESFNYGAGSVRAKAAPQFRSVAQIKKNRGKLTDPESMEKVKEEANSEMIELESELDPYLKQGMKSDNPFSDIFSYRLQEAAEIGVRSLRDYYEDGAPFEKVSSFLNKLKDLPSDYFEAKFPRAVQLEEFEAAIIPSDLDPKLKKVLEDRGLELREYSKKSGEFYRDDETPRREALQKQTEEAGLRFMPEPAENRSSKVNNIESKISKTVESEKNKISVERLPEDNFDSDAFSEEILVSANGIDVSASIFKRKDSDLYEISYSKWGEEDRWTAKTLDEAIKQAKEEIGIEVEEYHSDIINRYERGDLLQDIKLPENWEVDDIVTSGGGSVYYKLRENVEFDADGDVVDYNEYKVRIADHDASPFREREFGENDFDVEVSDLSARELDRAIGDVESWAERRSRGEIENLRFMPQPTFYSKAERAVEGAKAGIFNKEGMTSVGQAKALLEKNAPETELEWSGVLDYLDLQKEEGNKVSKQDLLSYLKNNGVEVEEVYRGGADPKDFDASVAFINMPPALAPYNTGKPIPKKMRDSFNAKAKDTDGNVEEFSIVREKDGEDYTYYVVGEDNKRVNIEEEAPAGKQDLKDVEAAIIKFMEDKYKPERPTIPEGAVGPTLFSPTEQFAGGPASLPGGENYSELVLKLPDSKLPKDSFDVPSGHRFPEENILAHIRFTERTDADGKRMLFLDEVQSDWNSEGRERGFKVKKIPTQPNGLPEGYQVKRQGSGHYAVFKEEGGTGNPIAPFGSRFSQREAIEYAINHFKKNQPVTGVPDMPYKGSKWQDLVMKRMIRWAADNGYDRLGWITGKDTADRYDLSKVINEIAIPTVNENSRAIRLETGKGDSFKMMVDNEGKVDGAFKASQFNGKQLDEVIGKELAEKVMAFKSPGSLTGTDLRVGGEWASNLYDKSLPKIARKITKKKGAVGRVGIFGSSSKLNGALAKNGIKPKYEANYVDISPEVKELAQEGFSYFMPEGRGGAASAPVQASAPQPPSGVIIPKVKLTEDEKEESRQLLQQLLD